jgi:predicted transport protein
MPIFQINNHKAKQVFLNLNHFESEAELRDFFADNLNELLGMRFIANEYPTADGRIDTLALDDANCPVIIEYKWGQDNAIFVQGLFYYDWLKKNKKHFDLLVADKFGKEVKVNWMSPRVILIAQGFDNRTISAVQQVDNVELIKYMPYQQDILYLENVYTPNKARRAKGEQEIKHEERNDEKFLDVPYHLNKSNSTEEIKKIFYKLEENINSLPEIEEIANQKTGITYRTTKSFARFEFGKTFINILLRDAKYIDPKKIVRDIESFKWGYKGLVKIKSEKEIDDVFDLIKQSYQSTL